MKLNLFHMAKSPAHTHTRASTRAHHLQDSIEKLCGLIYCRSSSRPLASVSRSALADWSVGILKSPGFTRPAALQGEQPWCDISSSLCSSARGLEDQPSVFTLFIKSVTHKGLRLAKSISCLKRPSDLIRPEFKLLNFSYLVWRVGLGGPWRWRDPLANTM